MKRTILIISLVTILIAAGGGYYWLSRDKSTPSGNASQAPIQETTSSDTKMVDDACGVFSPPDIAAAFKVTVELDSTKNSNMVEAPDGTSKQTCYYLQPVSEAGNPQNAYTFSLEVENKLSTTIATKAHEGMNVIVGYQSYDVVPGVGLVASFKRNDPLDNTNTQLEWVSGQTIYRFTAIKLSGVISPQEDFKIKTLVNTKF